MPTPSYCRPTSSSSQAGQYAKTAALVSVEVGAREANIRAARTRAVLARHRATYDSRRDALNLTSRAHSGRWADVRSGDFGLLPCALPMQRRHLEPDPVERALEQLQRKPDGWLVYEQYEPKYIRDKYAELVRARDEAAAAAQREIEEAEAAAAAEEAARKEADERYVAETLAALNSANKALRADVESRMDAMGKLV